MDDIFPQTNIKSNGNNFTTQNRTCDTFTGIIKAIRGAKSARNASLFAIVDLEVEGQPGVFQDFLNFNPAKETQSMSYLVNHTKAAILSAGLTIANQDEEKDMTWVRNSWNKLMTRGAKLRFVQTMNGKGQLDINFVSPEAEVAKADF